MWSKLFVFLFTCNLCCGQLPNTDLWLFSLKNEKGNYKIIKGENITKREGYDNQPVFSPDGKQIYYVSIREDKQADVYVYDTGSKKSILFLKTSESEYSPTFTPAKNIIACVTVMADSSQIILPFDIKRKSISNYPERKVEDVQIRNFDSVGYFTFLNKDSVLYYKLTEPHSIRIRSISQNKDEYIASSPIRGFKAINRNEFIFGVKDSSRVTYYRYDCLLQKANRYAQADFLSEDIVWHPQLGLLRSEATRILRYSEKEAKWILLFDLTSTGIKKITRFAFDAKTKRLVIVDNV